MADNKKFVKDWIAAWNSHDPDKVLPFYTDDCVYGDLGAGKLFRGKKEIADFAKSTFVDIPGFHLELTSWFTSGNWGACECIMSGTHKHSSNPAIPATGKQFSVSVATIIELRDGKINRETDYYNRLTIMQQLGLMPPMPSK